MIRHKPILESKNWPSLNYNAKIIFENKSLAGISKNYLSVTNGNVEFQDVTYKIGKNKNNESKRKLNFFSMIPVRQDYIAPPNIYVVHYGRPQMNSGVNVNMNVNIGTTIETAPGHQHGCCCHDNHHQNDRPKGCRNKYAMSPSDFNSAMEELKKQNFEDSKMKTAQQIVSANCVNTNQIKGSPIHLILKTTSLSL